MLLGAAALARNGSVEANRGVVAAREHAVVAAGREHRVLRVVRALLQVGAAEPVAADLAVEEDGVRVDAPEHFAPRHAVLLRKRQQELVELERAVSHVLCDHAAVEVDEDVRVLAL